jgi:hypothetical protein
MPMKVICPAKNSVAAFNLTPPVGGKRSEARYFH